MQAKIDQFKKRFSLFSSREKLMLLAALIFVFYQLSDSLIISSQFEKMDVIDRSIKSGHEQIKRMSIEVTTLVQQIKIDPNKALQARIKKTKQQIKVSQQEIKKLAAELVAPQQMALLLEKLLQQQTALRLESLQTIAVVPLIERPKDQKDGEVQLASTALQQVYEHAFSLEFSGSYLATLEYLEALEALPWKFYWDAVEFEVEKYPNSRVRLKLHTLSLSENWIGV